MLLKPYSDCCNKGTEAENMLHADLGLDSSSEFFNSSESFRTKRPTENSPPPFPTSWSDTRYGAYRKRGESFLLEMTMTTTTTTTTEA